MASKVTLTSVFYNNLRYFFTIQTDCMNPSGFMDSLISHKLMHIWRMVVKTGFLHYPIPMSNGLSPTIESFFSKPGTPPIPFWRFVFIDLSKTVAEIIRVHKKPALTVKVGPFMDMVGIVLLQLWRTNKVCNNKKRPTWNSWLLKIAPIQTSISVALAVNSAEF